jgi:hypothetical protein
MGQRMSLLDELLVYSFMHIGIQKHGVFGALVLIVRQKALMGVYGNIFALTTKHGMEYPDCWVFALKH